MAQDKTKHVISKRRMSKEALEKSGIYKTVQEETANKLIKAQAGDKISKVHRRRQSVENLKAKGIIKSPNQATAEKLVKQINVDKLNKKLKDTQRLSKDQVQAKAIPVKQSNKKNIQQEISQK